MKKGLYGLLVIFIIILSACQRKPDIDAQFVSEIFSDLEIDTTHIFINRVVLEGPNAIDRVEMIDQSNPEEIIIHVMDTSLALDYKILITPNYIYDTRTMKKTPNPFENSLEGRQESIEAYMTLLDFESLELAYLHQLAHTTVDRIYSSTRINDTLRGRFNRVESLNNNKEWVEFIIYENKLLELHYRLEEDFRSTKQQSNYISGTHYYFSDQMPLDFPSLELFFED